MTLPPLLITAASCCCPTSLFGHGCSVQPTCVRHWPQPVTGGRSEEETQTSGSSTTATHSILYPLLLPDNLLVDQTCWRKSSSMAIQDSFQAKRGDRKRTSCKCKRKKRRCLCISSRLASPDYFTPPSPPIQRLPDNSLPSSSQSGESGFKVLSHQFRPVNASKVLSSTF